MASRQRPSTDSVTSDESTTSQSSIPYCSRPKTKSRFKAKDLLPFLNDIALLVDFPAVALGWCSSGVIEIHQAQELLRFNGDDVDKNLKVLDVFNQLRRQESRIPLFLRELSKSGESSATNRELYVMLSEKMIFSDFEVENACERKWNGGTKMPQASNVSTSSLTSSGIESSKEYHDRKVSTPAFPLRPRRILSQDLDTFHLPSPKSPPADTPGLLQKYNFMKEENVQLHKMLVETQSKLIDVQQQLIIMQNEQHIQQMKESMGGQDRKKSQHAGSLAAVAERQRKLSRSLDSLHHAMIQQQMDN